MDTKRYTEKKKTGKHQNYNKKNNKKKGKTREIRRSRKIENTLKIFKVF